MYNLDVSRLSTGELLTMLQAISVVLAEAEQREKDADCEEDYNLWHMRKKQFQSARETVYDEIGTRILDSVGIQYQERS